MIKVRTCLGITNEVRLQECCKNWPGMYCSDVCTVKLVNCLQYENARCSIATTEVGISIETMKEPVYYKFLVKQKQIFGTVVYNVYTPYLRKQALLSS